MVVDCRSLIEFCRAFEHHRNTEQRYRSTSPATKRGKSPSPFCEHSPSAAVDVLLLLLVLGALAVLTFPCLKLILGEVSDLLAPLLAQAPVAYALGFILILTFSIITYEIASHLYRKCGNPYCKGLRKAVEFDIQLESEECVRYLPPSPKDVFSTRPLELGEDHKELEAELRKMAPANGRTVLIFRAPCGCPAGRMEVWGPKKVRRIKK